MAEIAPRPDARTLVRKEPGAGTLLSPPAPSLPLPEIPMTSSSGAGPAPTPMAVHRPVIEPTARARYRIQFTVGQETHDKLRRLQALLRREIPDGDAGEIVTRALDLLLDNVERTKLASVAQPRPEPPAEHQPRTAIRFETDEDIRTPPRPSRYIPREVRRAVWRRDGGQGAFVATTGRRCSETAFLELHHVRAYAKGGPATVTNLSLRCRRHNQYEAEILFGPRPARAYAGEGTSPSP